MGGPPLLKFLISLGISTWAETTTPLPKDSLLYHLDLLLNYA